MKKVLGIVFSIVGNIGTFLLVLATLGVIALGVLTASFDMVLAIVLIVSSIACFIIANIGNKIEDSLQNGLKVKFLIFKLLGWIPNLAGMILGIAGAFVIVAGVVGIFAPSLFEVFIPIESVENYGLLTLGVAMLVGGSIWINLYGAYTLHHCKHCGCNLNGGGYEYEEIERRAFVDNSNKVNLSSKIRFEFECPECGESTVFFKTLKTDGEQIDKFARSVIGR